MPYPEGQYPQVGDTVRTCKANEGNCTHLKHVNVGDKKHFCLMKFQVTAVVQGPSPEDKLTTFLVQVETELGQNAGLIDWRWCTLISRNSIKGTITEPEQPDEEPNRLSLIED